jgi:hypothetical protein
MKEKQWLVSESELKQLIRNVGDDIGWVILKDFLKDKQPVSTLDRDRVIERFNKFLMRNNFHPYSKEMNCVRDFLIEEICNLKGDKE